MTDSPPPHAAFAPVRARLAELQQITTGSQVDLIALGKAYAGLAEAMVQAIAAVGQTSMRFTAVAQALDLRTTKSALQRFLADT